MLVRKVITLIVISKCELYALLCEITNIVCSTYLLGSIFFTYCDKYMTLESAKNGSFDCQLGKVRES